MCLAVPGKVLEIAGEGPGARSARVDFDGIEKQVNLTFVPEAVVGDYVLVHVGFAISIVQPAEAHKVFGYLRQIEALDEELPP